MRRVIVVLCILLLIPLSGAWSLPEIPEIEGEWVVVNEGGWTHADWVALRDEGLEPLRQMSENEVPPILMVSAKEKTGFQYLFDEMEKLSKNNKKKALKSRVSLSFAWESLLWNHKDINHILEKLDENQITLEEALEYLKGGL